jgi:hypothetical protein
VAAGKAGGGGGSSGSSGAAGGGDVELGAMYGQKALLETGGGALRAAHVSCSGLAAVDTAGGAVAIEGLEGNASLLSGGGPMQVHLHERFGSCFLDSAGGDVELFISPSASVASLQVQAGGGIAIDPALKVSGELTATSCVGTIAHSSMGGRKASAAAAAPLGVGAAEAHAAAAQHVEAARRVGSLGFSTEAAIRAEQAGASGASGTVWNASRLARAGLDVAGGGGEEAGSKLVVNAGAGGRVSLRALSWMDAIAKKVRAGAAGGGGGT